MNNATTTREQLKAEIEILEGLLSERSRIWAEARKELQAIDASIGLQQSRVGMAVAMMTDDQ